MESEQVIKEANEYIDELERGYNLVRPWMAWALIAISLALIGAFFYFTMTPAPNFAGLRRSPIQQVYQWVRRVQHMTVLSET